jgi:hypothetical protein
MNWWTSLLLTLGFLVIGLYSPSPVMMIIVAGSAVWAAIDSQKIGLVKYKSGISYHPIVLLIGVLGIWIIAFPWYLIVRGQILSGRGVLKGKSR